MHTDKKYNKVIEEWRVQAMLSYLYNHLETDSHEKLLNVISNYQDFVVDTVYNPNEQSEKESINNKKLKGYQFDSLVYRYIRAREQMAEYEYLRDRQSNVSNHIEWATYQQRANRDIMRFVQILDEVIGEHE